MKEEDEHVLLQSMAWCFGFLVLYILAKLVHIIWWKPKSTEKFLRKEGIKGTSYKAIKGDIPDMNKCGREASSKPINLNHQIVPRVIPFFHKMVQQYGEVSVSWFGRKPRVTIVDAELTRLILSNKSGQIIKPPREPYVKLLTKGLTSLEGENWSQRRKAVTSAFLLDKLKGMLPAFSSSCCTMIERWKKLVEQKNGGSCELDVTCEFDILTGDVISRAGFGSSYKEGKKIFDLQKEMAILVHDALSNIYIPGFRFIPTKKNKKRYDLDVQIKGILMDMIRKKEHAMKVDGSSSDLLSILLESREQRNSLTTNDVIEDCKLFYFAGQVTTKNLLVWTMVVLSIHPDWQEKARQEVLDIFGTKEIPPDFEAINRLKIVSMILLEVLRLYPPIPLISRYTRCETKVGSMRIPAGVELVLPLLLLHHDGRYWENPQEFNPERFTQGVSKASKDQNAFFPFGWGPRICPGQNFAHLESKMALAMILQHFSFHLSPYYTHAPCMRLTLSPQHGAPVIIQRISSI
ncbi:hypothetical protein PIB30_016590 [Stylosanthes scabra]|uniref:Cytochrome P450 n=1 Tax=Stylosanthes scabra TaxID=79078 RepID=A0ABU6T855_9FABA|nr:hypothetical protein [Stylosanthes scabra]